LNSNSKQSFPWPSYIDVDKNISDYFDITYIPQGMIVDRNGNILERFTTKESLVKFLEKNNLLKGKQKKK